MSAEDCVGCRHINNCLGDCVGYEEVKPQEQTNEEWFCQLPTEEKAKWLSSHSDFMYECGLSNVIPKIMHEEEWEYWLKEKHET